MNFYKIDINDKDYINNLDVDKLVIYHKIYFFDKQGYKIRHKKEIILERFQFCCDTFVINVNSNVPFIQ